MSVPAGAAWYKTATGWELLADGRAIAVVLRMRPGDGPPYYYRVHTATRSDRPREPGMDAAMELAIDLLEGRA